MNTIEALSAKQMQDLQRWAMHAHLYESDGFHAGSLESDGRKQKKIIRQLCEAGLINKQGDDRYTMNINEISNLVEVEEIDLCQKWDELHDKDYNEWNEDFLRTDHVTSEQMKYLLEQKSTKFYVMTDAPFRYSSYRFAETAGDPTDDRSQPWWGPFPSLAHAIKCRNRALKEFPQRGIGSYEIAFTSEKLMKHADTVLFNEKIDGLYAQNLMWGLEKLGIATTNDLYYPLKDGEEKRRPRISVTLDDGIVLGVRGSSLGDKSDDWENNLAKSVERHRNQIAESNRAIELLTKIDTNIQRYGGWAKFKADYREALTKAIRQQENA